MKFRKIAEDMKMDIIDLYQFVLDKKFKFRDTQHFDSDTLPQFAEYIVSELKRKGIIQ